MITEQQYKYLMDEIMAALDIAHRETGHIDEETLKDILSSIGQAEAAGFIFVTPLKLPLMNDKLKLQREAIHLVQRLRKFAVEYRSHVKKEMEYNARGLPK